MRDRKKMARIAAIALVAFTVLAIIAIFVFYLYGQYRERTGHVDDHEEDPDAELQETVAVYSQEIFDSIAGRERTAPQYSCMQDIFLLPVEKFSAPGKNQSPENLDNYYGATIDGKSLKGLVMTPSEWTYYSEVNISDGRKYEWYLRLDTELRYSYSVIRNTATNLAYFCTSDTSNVDFVDAASWMVNTLKINPDTVNNFKY